jgi:hypothetical protein
VQAPLQIVASESKSYSFMEADHKGKFCLSHVSPAARSEELPMGYAGNTPAVFVLGEIPAGGSVELR